MNIKLDERHKSQIIVNLLSIGVTSLVFVTTGCSITPVTPTRICLRYRESGAPVQGASVNHDEGVMFSPGRSCDEGTTTENGCVVLKLGILKTVTLYIETSDGTFYRSYPSHPKIDPTRTTEIASSNKANAPQIEVSLTEVK